MASILRQHGTGANSKFLVWPEEDSLRLLCLLQACSAVPLVLACSSTRRQYSELVALRRQAEADPSKFQPLLEVRTALADLQSILDETNESSNVTSTVGTLGAASSLDKMVSELGSL